MAHAVFAAQLALNYPSFADVCVTIRIYINLLRQSNLQLEGSSFWSCEALRRLPTPPKAKAGTAARNVFVEKYEITLATELPCFTLILLYITKECCAAI